MALKEIRYIGTPWQVNRLPNGSREIVFIEPEQGIAHILPLNQEQANGMAEQLRGLPVASSIPTNANQTNS